MKTLFLVNKAYSDYYVFCPFCKKMYNEDIEVDDYVASNCLFWCNSCSEIMICPTGYNDKHCELNNLEKGKAVNSCSKLLSLDEAKSYLQSNKMTFAPEEELENFYAYEIGILRITCLSRKRFPNMPENTNDVDNSDSSDSNDSNNDDKIKSWNVDVMRFCDLSKDVDHSHDGVYLYYKAKCSECDRYYESFIWGD